MSDNPVEWSVSLGSVTRELGGASLCLLGTPCSPWAPASWFTRKRDAGRRQPPWAASRPPCARSASPPFPWLSPTRLAKTSPSSHSCGSAPLSHSRTSLRVNFPSLSSSPWTYIHAFPPSLKIKNKVNSNNKYKSATGGRGWRGPEGKRTSLYLPCPALLTWEPCKYLHN